MLIGLPITKRCGVTFGFYLILLLVTIFLPILCFLISVTYNYRGDGSINRILLGTGIDVINNGDTTRFSMGVNASYVLGHSIEITV